MSHFTLLPRPAPHLPPELTQQVRIVTVSARGFVLQVLPGEAANLIHLGTQPALAVVYGPQGSGKPLAAAAVAARLGFDVGPDEWDGESALPDRCVAITNLQPPDLRPTCRRLHDAHHQAGA